MNISQLEFQMIENNQIYLMATLCVHYTNILCMLTISRMLTELKSENYKKYYINYLMEAGRLCKCIQWHVVHIKLYSQFFFEL